MNQFRWCAALALQGLSLACGSSGGSEGAAGSGGSANGHAGGSGGQPANTAGAAPNGGASGGVASNGGASSGGVGGAAVKGEHCDGGKVITSPFFSGVSSNCFGDRLAFDLPNPGDVMVDDIELPEALTPGTPSAASFEIEGGGALNIELWGSDAKCGKAKELLWVGPLTSKIVCASFTPTVAATHLLWVLRPLKGTNFISNVKALALCHSGTCSQPDGMGSAAGAPLVSTQSSYLAVPSWSYKGLDAKLGSYGRIFILGAARPQKGGTMAVTTGIFRAPTPFEPYGDAYYCVGEGSTMTDNGDDGVELSLSNITRLGTCEELKGNGTISMTEAANKGALTSSLTALTLSDDIVNGGCSTRQCNWDFLGAPKFVWVDYKTSLDVGNYFKPTLMQSPLTEAAIFDQETDASPLQLACGTSGTTTYDPMGTSTLDVTDLGDFKGCPGKPIDNDSVKLHLYR